MWGSASMFSPHISRVLFLVLLSLLLLEDSSNGAPFGNRKSGKPSSSVFSLFNLKEKSRVWTESVMRTDFDDLESSNPSKFDAINFTKAGNIANFLKLLEVDSMYLPVPVNFVFIGFEGNGNQEFKLNPEELERWFTKIDHIFEHTRIPKIGEILTPFYKINIDREQLHHLPLISHINYNFSVHAIQMGEKVTSIFERAIDVLGRRDDVSNIRDNSAGLWQVDVDMISFVFSSLVEYLELEGAYNIFILNPKHDAKRAKYGYRRGLSDSEINFLKENKTLQTRILQSGSIPEGVLALDKIKRPLYEKHPMAKFSWTVMEETETIEWYNRCLDELNNVEKLYQGKDTAHIIQSKVLQLLKGKNDDLKLVSKKDLESGDLNGFHAECLTDTWIGNQRWAFIDLSAGPFSWGPSVGGEGVRTEQSLPNVEKTIGAVAEISEDEAEDRLQEAIQEKFAVFGEKDHHAIDILLAEIDIYELFAFKHCKGRKVKLALCEELDERMHDLKSELQTFEGDENDESHKNKAIDALKRMENWNMFSDTYEEFQNYTVARDTFLSHLGATLWGSLRHIISPSLADGAFHYYEKISFQLFFVTQEKVRHINKLPLDLESLVHGLSSLVLPSQQVHISQHMLSLSEDPALAMAFSVAKRAAAVPLLLVNGTFRKTVRSYLDSSILQHQLQRLQDHASLKGLHAHSRSTLEIPIFWFIHSDGLLVDKHYQARALSDMVIVVQSEPSSWESHLQCNGQPLLWDLRRPTKAALAAVSEHLAGVLPLHLIYSQAHETAIEDWIWSVGCNPFSVTSRGWHISQFQSDTIARSYLLTTLEESIQVVNSAIHLLLMERTSEHTFKHFQSQERELLNKYNYVISLWRRISSVTGELRYADALRLLHTLEDATKGFADYVNATVASLHPIHCTRQRKVEVEFDMTTIPAFFVVGLVLWFVLKPRRPKPKIN
ncbi:transmembrane protein [Perilla frutescens var. hirtella]|uniref:Transmembrane protein n=1 Tax=Perilla frutescens var. hirtella TaxID=608512 RepID=A0AAD4IUM2_PERFH|nr:transmembrane protein [Perilla frutescens var. hirtella]